MNRLLVALILFIAFPSYAQHLPHYMTEQEKQEFPAYLLKISSTGITTPPASPVRTPAEWEEVQAVVVTYMYQEDILRQIIKYAREECTVIVICSDSVDVKNDLIADNIPLSNIEYIEAPYNTLWIRDYGPWSIYTHEVDSLLMVDWIYNRPRPKDDTIPAVLARHTGNPLYTTTQNPFDLIATGGNFMTDGFGTAFSSNLILDENPSKSKADIDSILYKFMGINNYISMTNLPHDNIHHIDMHMKLLDEETILVGEYPQGVADGPQIEANIQYIQNNFNSIFGTPYKIIRIPMPPDQYGRYPDQNGYYRTYTNAVFINKTLIVPTYELQYDTTALRILREALPGYRVVGINSNSIIPSSGAIHCITKLIATEEPVVISHQSIADLGSPPVPDIEAYIHSRSGIQSAYIFYRNDTIYPYDSVAMTLINPTDHIWSATLPPQNTGNEVYYYIKANSVSGKSMNRPMPAPDGYWHFSILPLSDIEEAEMLPFTVGDPYPNPGNGNVNFQINVNSAIKSSINLFNLAGNHIFTIHEGELTAGKYLLTIQRELLPAGIYFIQIKTPFGDVSKKIVLQ